MADTRTARMLAFLGRRPARVALWTIATAVLYYACQWFAMSFTLPGTLVAVVWPASGLATAIAILVSPWVAIGALIADFAFQAPGMGPKLALVSGLASSAQIVVISTIVRRFLGGARALDAPGGVVRYAIFAGLAGTTLSATTTVSALAWHGMIPMSEVPLAWLTWWASDVVSLVLLTPLVLEWRRATSHSDLPTRERAALVVSTGLVALALTFFAASHLSFLFAMLSLPLVGWAAFRFESRGVLLVSCTLAAGAFGRLVVPRLGEAGVTDLLEAQMFIALAAAIGLVVAAYVRRERARFHEAAKKEFAAVDEARNSLLRSFAHELNNPLTPMLLQIDLMRLDGAALTDEQRRSLDVIDRNTLRLSKLVRDLRDVSQLQANGGLRLERAAADLRAVARDAVESYQATAKSAGIHLSLEASSSEPVEGDVDRLSQVLTNLLGNAIKYTPRGGEVRVGVRSRRDRVIVSVEDTGPGLTSDQIARLYTPFSQVLPESTQKSGSGLGLHIARGIVQAHGGTIRCESAGEGHGATFTFEIPRSPVDGPPPAPTATRLPQGGASA